MSTAWIIASGKGGVGKSTITASVGLCMAREGRRVCIVDGDVGLRDQDALLGLEPHDYDLCTSASPEQTAQIFQAYTLVRSGEKHGTIGVVVNKEVIEITTFRTEGGYRDSRHPEDDHSDTCSMCGKFCAVRSMNKALAGEYIDIL